jgi:hypothetical protein
MTEKERIKKLKEALAKIADPKLRDHKEPDAYTELGCVMSIANEALIDDAIYARSDWNEV